MSSKRVIVHVACPQCRATLPLAGIVNDVVCGSCEWRGTLVPERWRWVLADDAHTVTGGEEILGETCEAPVTCRKCNVAVSDEAIERAAQTKTPVVACRACGVEMAVRSLPDEAQRPASWRGAHASVVIGEGSVRDRNAAPVNVPCVRCGAPLEVDGSTPVPVCSYCHTRTPIPPELWKRLHPSGTTHPFYLWMTPREATAASASRAVRSARSQWMWIALGLVVVAIVGTVVWAVRKSMAAAASAPPAGFGVAGGSCDGKQSACSLDKKTLLECENEKLVVALTCKGPAGCRTGDHATSVSCDYTRADENDPCNVKDETCSIDGKTELRCDGSKFVPAGTCKGPDGCTVTPAKEVYALSCDDHVADLGDVCAEDGRWACATNAKSLLRCIHGKFIVASTCKGSGACRVMKNRAADTTSVACDGTTGDEGDPCGTESDACSADGKSLLRCKDGHLARIQSCRRGCTPGDHVNCRN